MAVIIKLIVTIIKRTMIEKVITVILAMVIIKVLFW